MIFSKSNHKCRGRFSQSCCFSINGGTPKSSMDWLGAHPYFWKHPSLPRFNPSISTCCSAWAPTAYFASLYATNPALHHSNPTLWAECWRTTLGRNGVFEEGLWGGRVCWVENYQVCSRNKGLDVWTVLLKEGFWICISQSFFLDLRTTSFETPWVVGR